MLLLIADLASGFDPHADHLFSGEATTEQVFGVFDVKGLSFQQQPIRGVPLIDGQTGYRSLPLRGGQLTLNWSGINSIGLEDTPASLRAVLTAEAPARTV